MDVSWAPREQLFALADLTVTTTANGIPLGRPYVLTHIGGSYAPQRHADLEVADGESIELRVETSARFLRPGHVLSR